MSTTVPAAGGMLGRYQVLKPLAKGGMAEVLLARAIGLKGFERHVVIKRIRVEHGTEQKTIDMFLDEARLVAALHHRNIVQVLDVGEEDAKYFFAMEYVHGRDTRELLRHVKDHKQQIPIEHVLTIVTAAAAGLHYAHEQRGPDRKPLGIVHRDISPGNILVAFDGGVKVVDFGIAKADARTADTEAGAMKGKLGYMSPEQCRAQPVDRRTDVFLLGIVMWELCTVRRLFKADTRFETMSLIADGEIAPPSKYRKDLSADIEAVVMKALARTPAERYQTADELRVALETIATKAGMPLSAGRLSDYLKEQFGEVPEPWLVDEPVAPPPPEEIARRTSQQYAVPTMPASHEEPRPPAIATAAKASDPPADPTTPAMDPALEAIRTAKPVVEGEPSKDEDPPASAGTNAAAGPAPAPAAAVPAAAPAAAVPIATAARAATPRRSDTPVSWPVDPSSARRRRAVLIGIGVVVVAAAAFLIIAFSGADIEPAPAASQPTVTPAPPADRAHNEPAPSAVEEPTDADVGTFAPPPTDAADLARTGAMTPVPDDIGNPTVKPATSTKPVRQKPRPRPVRPNSAPKPAKPAPESSESGPSGEPTGATPPADPAPPAAEPVAPPADEPVP